GRSSLKRGETAVIPTDRFSMRGLLEVLVEFIHGLAESVVGEKGRDFVPLFSAIFFFILVNNLLGSIPGISPATENFNTTFALGIMTFLFYNYQGFKENGWHYLKHFMGPIIWIAPLMLVIEIFSHMIRPLTLGLRLANVIRGDHLVLGIFLDLVPLLVPVAFYLLGLFVSVVQALVFTLLSMVYVSMAIAHDH
ncbi:MAG: F0F1 ATP synthase subunit A, partial [Bdellovibrionaceae bacterium]|nr:F0F1 ATP synthase subunit A [Pseudobdellovibrionaceae bacterium]MDW8190274.1 F0F1 ATP synthase subunit A [Pseudobdellovibrionaceae bacterium]